MFMYCPRCASPQIQFVRNKKFFCPACDFIYYHNTAAATAGIISRGADILTLVRAKEPARGKLAFPGGFVDPEEGALEGLRRECREELGWIPRGDFSFFASFPNTYLYRDVLYNTCDLFFTAQAPELELTLLKLDTRENSAIHFVDPKTIDPEAFAFESARKALVAFLQKPGG